MNILLLLCFGVAIGEICVPLLRNYRESWILRRVPNRISLWNSASGNFANLEALKQNDSMICSVDIVNDLRGQRVVVAMDFMSPYILRNADNTGVTGLIGDVWTTLEETLKFKTIYGRARASASQTLMNGHAHALLVATAIYSYTSGYYTYSTPITTNSYALFVQSGGTRVSTWWYTRIFCPKLWLTIFLFVVCSTLVIMGMYYAKRIVCMSYAECDDELSSVSFDLLFVIGSISGQGFPKMPTSWSLRLVILSVIVMGMLVSYGFNSTLTSYLAIRGNTVPLASLEDVVQKRTHSLCMRNDSGAYIHFTKNGAVGGQLKDDWKDLVNNGCPDMRDTGSLGSKLCQPGLAFLEAPDIFLPIYKQVRDNCRIMQLPDVYWSLRIAFLHARSAKHRQLIDVQLMRLRSAGVLQYLERKWISKDLDDAPEDQWSDFQPVESAHIQLASLALSAAMVLSLFICVLENVWHRLKTKPDNASPVSSGTNTFGTKLKYKEQSTAPWNPLTLKNNLKRRNVPNEFIIRGNQW